MPVLPAAAKTSPEVARRPPVVETGADRPRVGIDRRTFRGSDVRVRLSSAGREALARSQVAPRVLDRVTEALGLQRDALDAAGREEYLESIATPLDPAAARLPSRSWEGSWASSTTRSASTTRNRPPTSCTASSLEPWREPSVACATRWTCCAPSPRARRISRPSGRACCNACARTWRASSRPRCRRPLTRAVQPASGVTTSAR